MEGVLAPRQHPWSGSPHPTLGPHGVWEKEEARAHLLSTSLLWTHILSPALGSFQFLQVASETPRRPERGDRMVLRPGLSGHPDGPVCPQGQTGPAPGAKLPAPLHPLECPAAQKQELLQGHFIWELWPC